MSLALRDAFPLAGVQPDPSASDADLVQVLRRVLHSPAPKNLGAERLHYEDVRELSSALFRVDHFRFWCQISTVGVINTQAVALSVPKGLDFVLKEVRGYIQEAAADQTPDNWARVFFQLRADTLQFDTFTSPICMAELVGALSPAHPFRWDRGFMRFQENTRLNATFTVDLAGAGPGAWTASANNKVFAVSLIGDLVLTKS